uniref:Plastid lipid-associated protein/fibrillin conserved domain-containing protein n=1 Tax=Odontella aurita TaxID=265563 RepID=A0A7S4JQH5_9STRA|mmetsp:Transcript_51376/g.154356  ORF Transcript_51376/g.154356 Transcript_51376/m.154356 type:complete len:135 (+) Transcript_51376:120-524(+)
MRAHIFAFSFAAPALAFAPLRQSRATVSFGRSKESCTLLRSSSPSDSTDDPFLSSPTRSPSIDRLESQKSDLVRFCTSGDKPSIEDVRRKVEELEMLAEQVGMGQASSCSGLLSGEWCVVQDGPFLGQRTGAMQ